MLGTTRATWQCLGATRAPQHCWRASRAAPRGAQEKKWCWNWMSSLTHQAMVSVYFNGHLLVPFKHCTLFPNAQQEKGRILELLGLKKIFFSIQFAYSCPYILFKYKQRHLTLSSEFSKGHCIPMWQEWAVISFISYKNIKHWKATLTFTIYTRIERKKQCLKQNQEGKF